MTPNKLALVAILLAFVGGVIIGMWGGQPFTVAGRIFVAATSLLTAAALIVYIFWDRWHHE